MLRFLAVTTLCVASLDLGSGDAIGATRVGRCEVPSAAKVLTRDRHTVVYAVVTTPARADAIQRTYGCLRSLGRRRLLVQTTPDGVGWRDEISPIRRAGRFVAIGLRSTQHYGEGTVRLIVYDLRQGRVTRQPPVGGFGPYSGSLALLDVALTTRGAVAWRTEARPAYPYQDDPTPPPTLTPPSAEVVVADSHGRRVLARALPGQIDEFRLDGRVLTWRVLGQVATATLR